jgi:bifunctional non-homologous end joining protein LigD
VECLLHGVDSPPIKTPEISQTASKVSQSHIWMPIRGPNPTPIDNRTKQFVIDGEAVILGADGVSDFDALHSGRHGEEVQLYAFDVLAMDGDDLRDLPLSMRKTNLARLLRGQPDGMFIAPFEQGEIGPDLFRKACDFGLEGLVSKRLDRRYRGGRSPDWIKVKNPAPPAVTRVKEAFA